jgi:ribosomal protein S18 acetylase RimI-like enzyme
MGHPEAAVDEVAIRRATPADAGPIAAIRVQGWQSAYRGHLDENLLDKMSIARDEIRWRDHLSSPPEGHRGFIAERRGEAVGFVTCGTSRDEGTGVAEIYAIYVLPHVIGTGVGRALLAEAMDALRRDGYAEAMLWVLETNERAHRFYEAAGWRLDGDPKDDVLDGFAVREVRYRYRFDR